MNNLKCPNCGADITTDDAQTSGKCPYCNSRFAAEKRPEPKPDTTQETYAKIYNSVRPKKPRPRLRFGILLLLFFFGGPLFLVYIIYVEARKRAWDLKYLNDPSTDHSDIFKY